MSDLRQLLKPIAGRDDGWLLAPDPQLTANFY